MQIHHPDAADFAHSLDDIYFFGGMTDHFVRALYHHHGDENELDSKPGDEFNIAGNHYDGFSKLKILSSVKIGSLLSPNLNEFFKNQNKLYNKIANMNIAKRKEGLYPSYKLEETYQIVKYPSYEKVTHEN